MPSETTLTQGQTLPAIAVVCSDPNGIVDFTLATSVTFTMRESSNPNTIKVNAVAATFGSPRIDGELIYQQIAADVNTVEEYISKFRVVWADGRISYHPTSKVASENYHLVHVVDDAGPVD